MLRLIFSLQTVILPPRQTSKHSNHAKRATQSWAKFQNFHCRLINIHLEAHNICSLHLPLENSPTQMGLRSVLCNCVPNCVPHLGPPQLVKYRYENFSRGHKRETTLYVCRKQRCFNGRITWRGFSSVHTIQLLAAGMMLQVLGKNVGLQSYTCKCPYVP